MNIVFHLEKIPGTVKDMKLESNWTPNYELYRHVREA